MNTYPKYINLKFYHVLYWGVYSNESNFASLVKHIAVNIWAFVSADAPGKPRYVVVSNLTESSALVLWTSGDNGGMEQTFAIHLKQMENGLYLVTK